MCVRPAKRPTRIDVANACLRPRNAAAGNRADTLVRPYNTESGTI